MRKTVDILGIPVDAITMKDAVERVGAFVREGGAHAIYTPNAEIMMAAQRDHELKEILKKSDMLVADGAGVVLASKLLGRPSLKRFQVSIWSARYSRYMPQRLELLFVRSKTGFAQEAGTE
jgi:N-acetylglucosaminyldiphosphoundecaprenol N-acetyl-beta-D-mannosaminyltransferase